MVEQITFLAVISYKVLVVIRLFGIVIFGTVVTHITHSVVVPIALVSISLPRITNNNHLDVIKLLTGGKRGEHLALKSH